MYIESIYMKCILKVFLMFSSNSEANVSQLSKHDHEGMFLSALLQQSPVFEGLKRYIILVLFQTIHLK